MLNSWLLNTIKDGQAILFLGAGATIGAKRPDGKNTLDGNQLRDLVSDKFLDGKKKNKSLAVVADFAANLSSLYDLQAFVRDEFTDLEPADFHRIIPTFKWRAIFSTNYDLVIEKAYENTKDRLQLLSPIINDKDDIGAILKDPKHLPYIKLHGCINHIDDLDTPLILASEQYAKYENNRKNLFGLLKEWGLRHPIIFCGYEIEDPNILHILFDLNDLGINRPVYVVVNPSLDEIDEQFWKGRRFATMKMTFELFLKHLSEEIPDNVRILSSLRDISKYSISSYFKSNQKPSDELLEYLDMELEHVHDAISSEGVDPQAFYRGIRPPWDAFRQELDVKRRVSDDIILNWFLTHDSKDIVHCFLLKGYAGSGKSIVLRRAVWDTVTEFRSPILFLKEGGCIRRELIAELSTLVGERMIIIIEDVLEQLEDALELIKYANSESIRLNLVFSARTNEWNVFGTDLAPFIESEYELRDLAKREILKLISKLEENNCLGHMSSMTDEERIDALTIYADRQILVALHEATSGKLFEEIIYDEYNNIFPEEARILYLDICTLHRLDVPVRAGLIHRISGISFENFKDGFFKPLEHVVRTYRSVELRDYVYKSRHHLIAKFVFERALRSPESRAEQIIRMLKYMNIEYRPDHTAFSQIIKGKTLKELFADRSLSDKIYEVAEDTGADKTHIYHQRAVFELNHDGGSTSKALSFIEKAEELSYVKSPAIAHTKAMIFRALAIEARAPIVRAKYRQDARSILRNQLYTEENIYPITGLAQMAIDEIKDKMNEIADLLGEEGDDVLSDRVLIGMISEAEEIISNGLQKFPNDEYLLSLKANLSEQLSDVPKAINALNAAFKTNPGSSFIATRLSQHYIDNNETEKALEILNKCKEKNPSSKVIHFNIAKVLISINEIDNHDLIRYHLRRSFTEGDTNHMAQMYYARQEFLYGNKSDASHTFKWLRTRRFSPKFLSSYWGEVYSLDGKLIEFRGIVKDAFGSYCFAKVSGLDDSVFIHQKEFAYPADWNEVSLNSSISFNLAFTVRGTYGINVELKS